MEAFILVKIGSGEYLNFAKDVKDKIGKIKEVKEVLGVFGQYDLVVRVEVGTLEELSKVITDKIRGIRGVMTTETLIVGF